MSGVLTAVSQTLQDADASKCSTKSVALLEGPIDECRTQLSDLHLVLVKQVSGRNRWIRMGRQLKWPLKEKETMGLIERIGRMQRNISLALHADDLYFTSHQTRHVRANMS